MASQICSESAPMRALRTFSSKFLTSPTQIFASKPPNSAQIWELRAPKICLSKILKNSKILGQIGREWYNCIIYSVYYLEVGWIILSDEWEISHKCVACCAVFWCGVSKESFCIWAHGNAFAPCLTIFRVDFIQIFMKGFACQTFAHALWSRWQSRAFTFCHITPLVDDSWICLDDIVVCIGKIQTVGAVLLWTWRLSINKSKKSEVKNFHISFIEFFYNWFQ